MENKTCCIITEKVMILNKDFYFALKDALKNQIQSGINLILTLKNKYVYDDIEDILNEFLEKYNNLNVLYLLFDDCLKKKEDISINSGICKLNNLKNTIESEFLNNISTQIYRYMIDKSDIVICRLQNNSEILKYARDKNKTIVAI